MIFTFNNILPFGGLVIFLCALSLEIYYSIREVDRIENEPPPPNDIQIT